MVILLEDSTSQFWNTFSIFFKIISHVFYCLTGYHSNITSSNFHASSLCLFYTSSLHFFSISFHARLLCMWTTYFSGLRWEVIEGNQGNVSVAIPLMKVTSLPQQVLDPHSSSGKDRTSRPPPSMMECLDPILFKSCAAHHKLREFMSAIAFLSPYDVILLHSFPCWLLRSSWNLILLYNLSRERAMIADIVESKDSTTIYSRQLGKNQVSASLSTCYSNVCYTRIE